MTVNSHSKKLVVCYDQAASFSLKSSLGMPG